MEVDLLEDMATTFQLSDQELEALRDAKKRFFLEVLKKSSSKSRKVLRWRTVRRWYSRESDEAPQAYKVVESAELEVLPETTV